MYWRMVFIGRRVRLARVQRHTIITIKKHEQVPVKLGMLNPIYFLMWAPGGKINITQIEGQIPQVYLSKEEKEEFVKELDSASQ